MRLKQDNALPTLFSFLARPSTADGILTIQCLVTPVRGGEYSCDAESAAVFLTSDALGRVLRELDNPHGDGFLPAALCLACIAGFSKEIGDRLVRDDVFDTLVGRLETNLASYVPGSEAKILAAMRSFVRNVHHEVLAESIAAVSAARGVGLFLKVNALSAWPRQAAKLLCFLQLRSPVNGAQYCWCVFQSIRLSAK
jgi:hypothetical protein